MPKQVGEFIVPAIRIGDEKSKPFQISVKPASQTGASDQNSLIFELFADRTSLYVQSQVVVTLRLMSDRSISGYQMGDLVINDMDVVIEPLGEVKQYETRIADKPYLVLEKQFALFPQQSGSLTINPVHAEVQSSRRSLSLFDPFPNRGNIRRVVSPGLTLEVNTVAESISALNWLPSTRVQISEKWQGDLSRLVAGEPITRSISLEAEGLTAAQLPELIQGNVDGIKLYPDQPLLENARSSTGIIGSRQQKIALIPTAAGRYQLAEISIPWWNVETGQAEVARIPARTIEVAAPAINNRPQVDQSTPVPALAATPAITTNSDIPPATNSESNHFWAWLSLILALGWFASGLFWYLNRRRLRLQQDAAEPPVALNSLRAASKALEKACKVNDANQARDALLQWANALPTGRSFTHLNQLERYFGAELKAAIDALNQSLYSQQSGSWNGASLWKTCESIAIQPAYKTGIETNTRLQPLNPGPASTH